MEALERNRLAKCSGHTGNHFAKTGRLRDQTRNRRQHVHWISLEHDRMEMSRKAGFETHQYNPTYMPASTPVRVAIVVAALVAVVAGYRWWSSPERQVNRLLSDVASALSHEAPKQICARRGGRFAADPSCPDVSIDVGGAGAHLRGRQEVIAMAAAFAHRDR